MVRGFAGPVRSVLAAAAAGIVAAAIGGALTARLVQGFTLDWFTFNPGDPLSNPDAATILALVTGVLTILWAAIVVTLLAKQARRGLFGGSWRSRRVRGPATAGGVLATYAVGTAALMAAAAAAIPYLTGPQGASEGFVRTLGILFPGLGAFVATFVTLRTMGDLNAAGVLLDRDPAGGLVAKMAVGAARNPMSVLLVVLLVTAGLGAGLARVHTNVDVTDVLPRNDPNTEAAENLSARFKSAFTQQVSVWVFLNQAECEAESQAKLPNRQDPVNCEDITDEVYVRAMAEMQAFVFAYPESPFRYAIGAHTFFNLINWTLAGGQDAPDSAFSLPGTDSEGEAQYALVNRTLWTLPATRDAITAPMDPSRQVYTNLYMVEAKEELGLKEIGESAIAIREAYIEAVEAGDTEWAVFGADNPPLLVVDIPVANAHSSELVAEDFRTLFPIVLAFLLVALYAAFRNVRGILIGGSMLVIAAVWVFGLMGWAGIALNTLNLVVVPMILGVGIDYAIHLITEYQEGKRLGLDNERAVRHAGEHAGNALGIATLTTIIGMSIIALSPSWLIGQLGILSAGALAAVFILSITYIPALITLSRASEQLGKSFQPSAIMPGIGGWVSRARGLAFLFLVVGTVVAALNTTSLTIEPFGEPAKNFPEDDPFRVDHETGIADFYDLDRGQAERKTNILVFQGDILDPRTHEYIDGVQAAMRGREHLDLNTSRNLPFLMRTWLTVKDGPEGAGLFVLQEELSPLTGQQPYPSTREEMKRELDAAFASPLATFASLFTDYPTYEITIMTFATETGSFEAARDSWNDVWASVATMDGERPASVQVAFAGNTATNYLFIQKELPWLTYLSVATLLTVTILVGIVTRSVRATVAVGVINSMTSVWWLGILPLVDVGLAITLVFPLVFISAVGSDYAVHMAYSMEKTKNPRRVYAVVGKSILFSAFTTIGAFLIFTRMQNLAMAKTMLATSIAIGVMFVLTSVFLAVLYPFKRSQPSGPLPAERVQEPAHAGES